MSKLKQKDSLFRYDSILYNYIEKIVISTREDLAKEYDVTKGNYKDYTGLCDKAYELFKAKISNHYKVIFMHGEQKHNPRIESIHWFIQHTWIKVEIGGIVVYVDPTSSQFKTLYNDIPDYYISLVPPKWYYPDSKNPRFNKVIFNLVERRFRIIELFQYMIWGSISDFIRKVF